MRKQRAVQRDAGAVGFAAVIQGVEKGIVQEIRVVQDAGGDGANLRRGCRKSENVDKTHSNDQKSWSQNTLMLQKEQGRPRRHALGPEFGRTILLLLQKSPRALCGEARLCRRAFQTPRSPPRLVDLGIIELGRGCTLAPYAIWSCIVLPLKRAGLLRAPPGMVGRRGAQRISDFANLGPANPCRQLVLASQQASQPCNVF